MHGNYINYIRWLIRKDLKKRRNKRRKMIRLVVRNHFDQRPRAPAGIL